MALDDKIKKIAEEIRSYGAVAIIGAGISLGPGFPLSAQLQALLWQALDSDETALHMLANEFGQISKNAKALIGDDPHRINCAFKAIASSSYAWRKFQSSFKSLNDERIKTPSKAHDVVCELLHRQIIKKVISLNWDTLLETSYHRRYGGILKSDGVWLIKPNGDASSPSERWIYPGELGPIQKDLLQDILELKKNNPKVLLIIGYSERDIEIVSKVIEPLSDQWRVVRIGPEANGEWDIPESASVALIKILKEIDLGEEIPGWEYVNFDNQRDLVSALIGYGLGPKDVAVCPRLPESDLVKQQIELVKNAVIVGKGGCGKSMVAYQVAYDLNNEGWEILRLVDHSQPKEIVLEPLYNLQCKTALIIDNAHLLKQQIITTLIEMASDRLAVIIVLTIESSDKDFDEHIFREKIPVANRRAVSIIAESFKKRQAEILPIVKKLDNEVGDAPFEIPLEYRIDEASKSDFAWQFNFILTGGWKRAKDTIANLREMERFDLLLAAIAARQLTLQDASVSLDFLELITRLYNKDTVWLNRGIKLLTGQRLIIDGNIIRCPHLRFSSIVLDIVFNELNDPDYDKLIEMFRAALIYKSPPILGIYWALNSLRFNKYLRYNGFYKIMDFNTWNVIFERCCLAQSNEDIGNSAIVLDSLNEWYPKQIEALNLNLELLGKWVERVDADSAIGLGWLLNDLGQKNHLLTERIISLADPICITGNIRKADSSKAYAWGHFLGRLAFAGSNEWLMKLRNAFNKEDLEGLFLNVKENENDLYSILELAEGISCFNNELSLELVDLSLNKIINSININLIKFSKIFEFISFVLGYAPDFLRHGEPTEQQKQIAIKLANGLDPNSISYFISNSNRRDWESIAELIFFAKEVMPEKARQIVQKIDMNSLDNASKGLWENPPHELLSLLAAMAIEDNYDPARSWIGRHNGELKNLNCLLAAVAPESVISALKSGYNLNLEIKDLAHWNISSDAIRSISENDKTIAAKVLDFNCVDISQGFLLKRDDSTYEGFPEFLDLMHKLAPDTLIKCLELIDHEVADTTWNQRLHGKREEYAAAKALIKFSIRYGPRGLAEIAEKLNQIYRPIYEFPEMLCVDLDYST